MALWSFPCGKFPAHDPRNASLDEITHLMWEESKETDQGPDDLEHLVLKHLKSMNNPMMITMINNTCLSLVSFSMKYLRNRLLSSTRKLQITFLLEISDSSIQSGWEDDIFEILKGITSSSWKQSSSPSWWSSMREISNLVDWDHHHHLLENHHHHPDEKNLISNLVDCDPVWGGRMVLQ